MYIDAHFHLDLYEDGAPAALAEIARHHIFAIAVALDSTSYAITRRLAAGSPWVLPTYGVHPCHAADVVDRLDELGPLVDETPMIGEVGLDHHFVEDAGTYPAQMQVLEFFLEAAREQDKVVNLHTKGAEHEVAAALQRFDTPRAIVHWYSGAPAALRKLVELGAYFTVGVEVLRGDAIREIARRIPPDRLLTETDNPGGHRWLTGDPGQPALLCEVVAELGRVLGTSAAAVEARVQENFLALVDGDERLTAPLERAAAAAACA